MKYIIKDDKELQELDFLDLDKLTFKKIDNNRINLFYDNKIFYLDLLTIFKTYGLQNNYNRYKISIILDITLEEHKKIVELINHIYNELTEYLLLDDNDISMIKNPLTSSRNNIYILNLVLHSSCTIVDYNTRRNLDLNDIKNKKIYLYPIICNPMFLIYNNICYTSYSIHEAYVILDGNKSSSKNLVPKIDVNNVTQALNRLNLNINK